MRTAAAASTIAGALTAKSGLLVLPDAEHIQSHGIRELDFFDQVANALVLFSRRPVSGFTAVSAKE